jgi:hypothetical protein
MKRIKYGKAASSKLPPSRPLKLQLALNLALGCLTTISFVNEVPDQIKALHVIWNALPMDFLHEFRHVWMLALVPSALYFGYSTRLHYHAQINTEIARSQRELHKLVRAHEARINSLKKLPRISRNSAERHYSLIDELHERRLKARLNRPSLAEFDYAKQKVADRFVVSCSDAARELSIVTGLTCQACIKTLRLDGTLHTLARASDVSEDRRDADKLEYSSKDNTAFNRIKGGHEEFVENDLIAMSQHPTAPYVNQSPNWRKFYTATYVIPLYRLENGNREIRGFFCADNRGGNFDGQVCREIMKRYACVYERVLKLLDDYESTLSTDAIEIARETNTVKPEASRNAFDAEVKDIPALADSDAEHT